MQSLQIPVRARVGCNVDTLHAGTVRESMLCVGLDMPLVSTPTICDSTRGAGLLCQGRFVGVASFGFGCGSSSLPGVYTQVKKKLYPAVVCRFGLTLCDLSSSCVSTTTGSSSSSIAPPFRSPAQLHLRGKSTRMWESTL